MPPLASGTPGSVDRTRTLRLVLAGLSLLWLSGGAVAAPPPDGRAWLELRPHRGRPLWVDLEREVLWLAGRCDRPYALRGLERTADGFRARAESPAAFDLARGRRVVRERLAIEARGGEGTLRVATSLSPRTLLQALRVSGLDLPPCGG